VIYTQWWDNPDELKVWAGGAHTESWLYYSPDGGQTWDDRTPLADGHSYGADVNAAWHAGLLLHHFVTDPAYMAFAGRKSGGGANNRLFTSLDQGQTWQDKGDMGQVISMLGGWPYDQDLLIATGVSKIRYSEDWGVTWVDKQWPGYADGLVTVPIWVV
jgi:hypothetical protein